MTIQPIGTSSVALYITPRDLEAHGLTPENLSLDHALTLTRNAFAEAGIPCTNTMEIEAYPNPCGVLVFARLHRADHTWLSFPDAETLIAAARCLDAPYPDATLYFWQGSYWLSLPNSAEQSACRLSEFGTTQSPESHFPLWLSEHGTSIFSHDALTGLLFWFGA